MRLDDLRPGWATDFILHRLDAEIEAHADCLVVRTPSSPTYYWGNCLLLPAAPRDDQLAHWRARFQAEISGRQPASRHVAIGISADWRGERLPAWEAAGFQRIVTTMLCIAPGGLVAARHPRQPEYRLRVLDAQRDAGRLFDLESTDAGAFDPAGYRRYLQRQWQRYRTLQDRGQMHWFGIEFDGRLVASCGLIRAEGRPGEAARFQRVITHPDFRRRGLASALVRAVTSFAFDQWRAPAVYMAADAEGIAVGLYRSLGYRGISSAWGLQCNAPEDRRA